MNRLTYDTVLPCLTKQLLQLIFKVLSGNSQVCDFDWHTTQKAVLHVLD